MQVRSDDPSDSDWQWHEPHDRRATRYGAKTVRKWASNQWNDKGILALTFYAFRNEHGQVYVEV